ncbi:alpha/beta fold hydrolase [Leifsonia sp. NPDC058248]|uniref:alpha/beta fold hydrolase n=1 Tax=Leifsonia sp. NPDC058248 TaxID=3346402 RepID=UPI0036DA815B
MDDRDHRPEAVVVSDSGTAGPCYLLIHGIGVSSRYFERLAPLLAEHGRVVTIDLPGFGRAPKPPRALTVEDFAEVVSRVIDRLDLGPCVVVGHSMGSQVVTRLAVTHPESVASLALLGPVCDPRDRSATRSGFLLAVDCLGESPRGNLLVLSDYVRCGIRWYLTVLPSMLDYRIEDEVQLVTAPVLVIRGVRDPIARDDWVSLLAHRAPLARAHVVDGARHLVMHSQPRRTADLLVELAVSPR